MTEEYKLQNGEGGCFACINSGQGFRSYFDPIIGCWQASRTIFTSDR